jgi:CheY-like chemotaxis protein
MKIFVLEDDTEYRIPQFQELFAAHNLVYAVDSGQALEALRQQKFDLIFLDHDLGGQLYVDSRRHNTGYQVAAGLRKTINAETNVVVHSWNPAGAENIAKLLAKRARGKVKRIPFGQFDARILREFQ